jgi:hypothetical protein
LPESIEIDKEEWKEGCFMCSQRGSCCAFLCYTWYLRSSGACCLTHASLVCFLYVIVCWMHCCCHFRAWKWTFTNERRGECWLMMAFLSLQIL